MNPVLIPLNENFCCGLKIYLCARSGDIVGSLLYLKLGVCEPKVLHTIL